MASVINPKFWHLPISQTMLRRGLPIVYIWILMLSWRRENRTAASLKLIITSKSSVLHAMCYFLSNSVCIKKKLSNTLIYIYKYMVPCQIFTTVNCWDFLKIYVGRIVFFIQIIIWRNIYLRFITNTKN